MLDEHDNSLDHVQLKGNHVGGKEHSYLRGIVDTKACGGLHCIVHQAST